MDKQKMGVNKQEFPLVEALLLTPPEGVSGTIGICTNTSAPGQIINDVNEKQRVNICVLGSLIVSRDGAERMIINSLVHPTLKYLILFSEESLTFRPSTNLLQALMNGFDESKSGNYISGGVAASSHYPSINSHIFETFKTEIIVIPAFIHSKNSDEVVMKYLEWLKPNITENLYELLKEVNKKEKIYFDSLQKIIDSVLAEPKRDKKTIELDPKDFQHLQPPKIILEESDIKYTVPFSVTQSGKNLRLDIAIDDESYFIIGDDPFLISYSLMKHIGDKKIYLSPSEQMLIGAELSRLSLQISNDIIFDSFVEKNEIIGKEQILIESQLILIVDKKYYYKINTRDTKISAMCLSFDVCDSVFELLSYTLPSMIDRLSSENRFEVYKMDILHRIDIGIQLGRAAIAAKLGYSFIQDFNSIFKINNDTLPSIIVDGDSFLDVHKGILRGIYTKGITEEHGDSWKGMARTASVLAVYRDSSKSLETMPSIYRQGDQDPKTIRANYKQELLRLDHDGTYTYGERTRSYFGFDQLEKTKEILKKNPGLATIVQRFDPVKDMSIYIDPDTGKTKFTHDPCLTHDIFFIVDNKLHSFHIARAHNAVNAYPENVFGLFDAYVTPIRESLNLECGDMYMLSNRANILLLTEEQRTKKILGEPSKPIDEINTLSGPYNISDNIKTPNISGGVAYYFDDIVPETNKPKHLSLDRIESYKGVDTLEKSIKYLKTKGWMHNNPIMSDYYAGESNPQAEQLAFLQANVFGGKLYITAVFINKSIKNLVGDKQFINYVADRFIKDLNVKPGTMNIYYVGYKL